MLSTRDVSRLLGLSPARVRAQARAGFLSPGRGPRNSYRFSFHDLVLLRTAQALAEAKVSPYRIRRALRRLVRQLPRGRSLGDLRISVEGDRIVVRDGQTAWNPESGQFQIDFAVADLATRAAPAARRVARAARRAEVPLTAERWCALGLDLEAVAPEEAERAYRTALVLDPGHVDAGVNLGRLLQESGKPAAAAAQYRAVLERHPGHATAAFNLGTALEDLGRRAEAIAAYRLALAADERFADAHFNLARLYESAGDRPAAIRHLRAYQLLSERR